MRRFPNGRRRCIRGCYWREEEQVRVGTFLTPPALCWECRAVALNEQRERDLDDFWCLAGEWTAP